MQNLTFSSLDELSLCFIHSRLPCFYHARPPTLGISHQWVNRLVHAPVAGVTSESQFGRWLKEMEVQQKRRLKGKWIHQKYVKMHWHNTHWYAEKCKSKLCIHAIITAIISVKILHRLYNTCSITDLWIFNMRYYLQ